MNILYLAHRIPYPPNKGDKLRAFRHLEFLSRRHRVWCAFFVDNPADLRHVGALRSICADVLAVPLNRSLATLKGMVGLARGGTLTEAFYRDSAMTGALRRLSERTPFDAVVAFSSSMAPYALDVPADRHVLDMCDCDSQKWLRVAQRAPLGLRTLYRREGNRLAARECQWVEAFDATIVIAESEAKGLRPYAEHAKIYIVGNGVDLPPTTPSPFKGEGWGEGQNTHIVGFIGVMNYFPNVDAVCWFAKQCWPAIRSQVRGAEFRIVGRCPARRVRRLGRIPGVTVVGEVENIADELRRFDVSVAPLRIACGVQNKVLEAMAAAKPVIVTPRVAAALHAVDGRECRIADTSTETILAVAHLLTDSAARARLGENARTFVAGRYRWEDQLRQFELVVTGPIERSVDVQTLGLRQVNDPRRCAVALPADVTENQPA